MRHRVGFRKLGRVTSHRTALLRNLATALFERERIRTTLMKAKELRPYAEKLITQAKRDDDRLHARRLVAREIHDLTVVKKLFDDLGARYASRAGGYTRILRLGPRRGDGAEMAIVELLGSEFKAEAADDKTKKTETESKPKPRAKAGKGAASRSGRVKAARAKSDEAGEKKPAAKGAAKKKKSAAKRSEAE
jgi:large subunit ribosomal protein L17